METENAEQPDFEREMREEISTVSTVASTPVPAPRRISSSNEESEARPEIYFQFNGNVCDFDFDFRINDDLSCSYRVDDSTVEIPSYGLIAVLVIVAAYIVTMIGYRLSNIHMTTGLMRWPTSWKDFGLLWLLGHGVLYALEWGVWRRR